MTLFNDRRVTALKELSGTASDLIISNSDDVVAGVPVPIAKQSKPVIETAMATDMR